MIPEIDIALKKVNISLKDIDSVALGIGPGSYTGIRIPLTIAKTLNVINKTKIIITHRDINLPDAKTIFLGEEYD